MAVTMSLSPRFDTAPNFHTISLSTAPSVVILVNIYHPLAQNPQEIKVALPRTSGLGCTFATIRRIAARQAGLDEELITEVRVDGIPTSFKGTPEQYGVSEGETIELFLTSIRHGGLPALANLGAK